MTVIDKVLVPSKYAENAQTTQYTATNCTALIDKATITNNSAANVTFSANLVTSGDTAGNQNRVIFLRSIAPNETYFCPELVNQKLMNGDFISTIAGTATVLTMRISGREIT